MKEEKHKKILSVIIALNRIFYSVDDRLFAEKIGKKTLEILEAYLDQKIDRAGDNSDSSNVAQCYKLDKLKLLLDSTTDIIEIFSASNIKKLSPIIGQSAIKKLLIFKMDIAKNLLKNRRFQTTDKPKNLKETTFSSNKKSNKLNTEMNTNKRKILEFIRSNPNIRTKDIVENFNEISGRTVKRNLSELLHEGFLNKKFENGGVYYF